jgi:hypothetical protein
MFYYIAIAALVLSGISFLFFLASSWTALQHQRETVRRVHAVNIGTVKDIGEGALAMKKAGPAGTAAALSFGFLLIALSAAELDVVNSSGSNVNKADDVNAELEHIADEIAKLRLQLASPQTATNANTEAELSKLHDLIEADRAAINGTVDALTHNIDAIFDTLTHQIDTRFEALTPVINPSSALTISKDLLPPGDATRSILISIGSSPTPIVQTCVAPRTWRCQTAPVSANTGTDSRRSPHVSVKPKHLFMRCNRVSYRVSYRVQAYRPLHVAELNPARHPKR